MSVSIDSGSGGRGGQSQDFELNLAPVIDCLTVLIAFMLASASFLAIGILDAGVAAAGASATDGTPPPVQVTVELAKNQTLLVKVTGKSTGTSTIEGRSNNGKTEWNYEEMNQKLTSLKNQWPELQAVTLTADNSIEYRDVVKTMEALRKSVPAVLLGGF